MRNHIIWLTALTLATSAHAATVKATIDGGTSYVNLGTLSSQECIDFMKSPAVIARGRSSVAVDGKIGAPDASLCHAHVRVALVSTEPVVSTTSTGVTTWPLAKDQCESMAKGLLADGPIRVNDSPVLEPEQVTQACNKRSNSVTKPL
jgi:hypothetical protein